MAVKQWTLSEIWNNSFDSLKDDPIKARGYLHASELGNSFIEIYYKLKGEPYTNTFTAANRRKMEAGKLFEAIIRYVLKRAGILKKSEETANYQIKGCLEVHGRLDFIAGGKVDIVQAEECRQLTRQFFEGLDFPPVYQAIADNTFQMVKRLAGKKNVPLDTYILELKSVADFVYRLIENSKRPLNFHHIQGFHYLLAKNLPLGKVVYLNRDDVRLMEKQVLNNQDSYKEYMEWVERMTDYASSATPPPKESLILFDKITSSFLKNTTGVEWCKYLTKIYGFKDPEAYREAVADKIRSMNYTFLRCVNCATLTADNKKNIEIYRRDFANWDDLVDVAKFRIAKDAQRKGAIA